MPKQVYSTAKQLYFDPLRVLEQRDLVGKRYHSMFYQDSQESSVIASSGLVVAVLWRRGEHQIILRSDEGKREVCPARCVSWLYLEGCEKEWLESKCIKVDMLTINDIVP